MSREKQKDENNQDNTDDPDATVTVAVAVAAEAATKASDEKNDKDDDKDKSERHECISLFRISTRVIKGSAHEPIPRRYKVPNDEVAGCAKSNTSIS